MNDIVLFYNDLKKFSSFYQFLRSTKEFYILPKYHRVGIIDTKEGNVTSPLTDEKIFIPDIIKVDLYKLPEKKYLGFIVEGTIKTKYISSSIFSNDNTFQTDTTILIFDIIDDSKTYDARIEELRLLLSQVKYNQIELFNPDKIIFTPQNTNLNIWKRLQAYSNHGDIFLRPWNHEIGLSFDIPIYKGFFIKKCKVIKKRESKNFNYLICKFNDHYFYMIAGISDDDFKNIEENDMILAALKSEHNEIICSVFIEKIFK